MTPRERQAIDPVVEEVNQIGSPDAALNAQSAAKQAGIHLKNVGVALEKGAQAGKHPPYVQAQNAAQSIEILLKIRASAKKQVEPHGPQ